MGNDLFQAARFIMCKTLSICKLCAQLSEILFRVMRSGALEGSFTECRVLGRWCHCKIG